MLVSLPQVLVSEVQIRLFRHCNAGVAQNAAEGVNIHAIHQATLGEVVPQTVGRDPLIYAAAPQIVLEVRLKVTDLNMIACSAS